MRESSLTATQLKETLGREAQVDKNKTRSTEVLLVLFWWSAYAKIKENLHISKKHIIFAA